MTPCDGCDDACCWEEVCQECNGTGIWQGCAINGIAEANWYGLPHPLNLLESCPACKGEGRILFCCEYYGA